MHLLIDIGNTSIKWACHDGRALSDMRSARHHNALPIDLLAAWEPIDGIDRITACCVGPDRVKDAVIKICHTNWQLQPSFITVEADRSPIRVAYPEPSRLGVDRWLALIAAHRLHSEHAIILNAGTAITCDALLSDGHHLGGLILPGIGSLRTALLSTTQIPPHESIAPDNSLWGTSTGQCIAAGCLHAPAALADRLCRQLRQQTGTNPRLLLTGGDAERLSPLITHPSIHIPDLVLQGLFYHSTAIQAQ